MLLGRNGWVNQPCLKALWACKDTKRKRVSEQREHYQTSYLQKSAKRYSYVPQGRDIFPQLTVHENLILGMERNGHKKKSIEEEIFELFPVLKTMLDRKGGI